MGRREQEAWLMAHPAWYGAFNGVAFGAFWFALFAVAGGASVFAAVVSLIMGALFGLFMGALVPAAYRRRIERERRAG